MPPIEEEVVTNDSATPAEAPVEDDSSSFDSVDWAAETDDLERGDDSDPADIGQGFTSEDQPDTPDGEPAKPQPQPEPGASAEPPPAEAEPPQAEEGAPQSPPEPAPAKPKPLEEPPQEQPTSEPSEEDLAAARQNYLGALEQHYALAEEDAEAFVSDPAAYLPKLAAKLHAGVVDVLTQSFGETLKQSLPQMVESSMRLNENRNKVWGSFQDAWPELTDQTLHPLITEGFQHVVQTSKGKPLEEIVRDVGVYVWMRSGRNPVELAARLANGESQGSSAPVAPQTPGRTEEPVQTSFAPGTRRPQGQPATQPPSNPFAELALSGFDDED